MAVYLAVPVHDTSVGRTGFDPMIFDIFVTCPDDVVSSHHFVLHTRGLNRKRL